MKQNPPSIAAAGRIAFAVALTASSIAAAGAARAADPTAPTASPARSAPARGASAMAVATGSFTRPVALATLAAQRGGDAVAIGAQLQGSVADNAVSQSATGSNTIAGGAFAGSQGIATVIQNTGNNVLIQNAVVVNLQLK